MLRRSLAITFALALLAAACGDDDATTTTAGAAPDGTTAGTAVPADTTPSTDAVSPPGETSDVDELLDRYETATIRTTYRIGSGDDAEEIVLAQDPNASPPVEAILMPGMDSKIVISEGTTTFCDGESQMCFELPGGGGQSLLAGFLGPFTTYLALAPDVVETDVEPITVAGRDGVCFTYTPPAGVEADTDLIRQCVDGELGFTLLMQSSETGDDAVDTVMELLDFALPTPDDFALPYPLQAAP